jgi:pSer/pThr/pTyr-binding forkhead associated (FHA) protein
MSDPRLDSMHLEFPRRDDFRRARQALLDARGWLTVAAEFAEGAAGEPDDWPSLLGIRPDQILPGTRFLLIEQPKGQVHSLRTGLNTIGRFSNNDIVLRERTISRRHCAILVHAWGGCEIHDSASRNGTWVNGERVHRSLPLLPGARIVLCERRLLFASVKDCQCEPGEDTCETDWPDAPPPASR